MRWDMGQWLASFQFSPVDLVSVVQVLEYLRMVIVSTVLESAMTEGGLALLHYIYICSVLGMIHTQQIPA